MVTIISRMISQRRRRLVRRESIRILKEHTGFSEAQREKIVDAIERYRRIGEGCSLPTPESTYGLRDGFRAVVVDQ